MTAHGVSMVVPVLSTSRLQLRPLVAEDAGSLFAAYSDPVVMEFWSCRPHGSVAQTRTLLELQAAATATGAELHFAIERCSDRAVIGACAYKSWRGKHRRGDLSYLLARAAWGQGYASESIERLLEYGFTELDLHSVEAGVTPGNADSGRLLERLGFRLEGHLRENYWAEDRFVDSLVYGLLRTEWAARRVRDEHTPQARLV